MQIVCTDCGKPTKDQAVERPTSVKLGMKSTTEVCKRCRALWYLKQARKEQRAFVRGDFSESEPVVKGINMAIKFLEEL